MAKAKKRVCKSKSKGKSRCKKGKGIKTMLKKKSPATIAKIGGVGLRTPKTHKLRTKKTLVALVLQKKSKLALQRRLHIKS